MYLGPCGRFTIHKWFFLMSDNQMSEVRGRPLWPQQRGVEFCLYPSPRFLGLSVVLRWINVMDYDSAFLVPMERSATHLGMAALVQGSSVTPNDLISPGLLFLHLK